MIYHPDKLLLVAGPCSLESWEVCSAVAGELRRFADTCRQLTVVFKGSFDKANRTSLESGRGPGMAEGLELLARVKETFGFPVVTDIHLPEQAAEAAVVCDVLQIPAFLCRQTDLLVAAAHTGRAINVKKGQFLSPMEMGHVVAKLERSGAGEIWQTDRGTLFGYQNLVVDMRSFPIMRAHGHPTLLDATHSVQLPGAGDGVTAGQREFVPVLARAALAAGADGLFIETHPDPANAISDAACQIPLAGFGDLIDSCLDVWRAVRP